MPSLLRLALRAARPAAAAAVVAAALAVAPREARSQESAVRFEITAVGDSTFTFPVGTHIWVRRGIKGIVVDPKRRDILVARFRVVGVRGGEATALVTGQTTRITEDNVALLDEPRTPFYQRGTLYAGFLAGLLLGAALFR
jgi:hypothetical protein